MKTKRQYLGVPIDDGGTSTRFNGDKLSPSMERLIKKGVLDGVKTIIDYGAGRYSRNAAVLRKRGYRVYAYDPFHGDPDVDGWEGVSSKLPRNKFDLGFTTFVLNVVTVNDEKKIIEWLDGRCRKHYHVVRDDLVYSIGNALARKDKHVTKFFIDEFATPEEARLLDEDKLPDSTLLEFCQFGTATSRGFQRLCTTEDLGLTPTLHKRGSFKIYQS